MHGFKRLGERVMARTFERQVVELHVRVALLNRFTQLGRPTTVPVAAMAQLRLGLGSSRAVFDLCSKAVTVLKLWVRKYGCATLRNKALSGGKKPCALRINA